MSFVHFTLVGHFDPRTVGAGDRRCARPIDPKHVERVLAEFPPVVATKVIASEGYVRCLWAPSGAADSRDVRAFAYWLARDEGCLAVENGRRVFYPPEAVRAQHEALEEASGWTGVADSTQRAVGHEVEAILRWKSGG